MAVIVAPAMFSWPPWVALVIAGLGLTAAAHASPRVARLAVMLLVACVLGSGLAFAQVICCQGCDPWWAMLWICV